MAFDETSSNGSDGPKNTDAVQPKPDFGNLLIANAGADKGIQLAANQAPNAQSNDTRLPDNFATDEHFWPGYIPFMGDKLDVKSTEGKKLGEIDQEYWRATPTFNLYDNNNKLLAHARTEFFTWGTTNDITDGDGKRIGTFKKEVFDSWWSKLTSWGTENKYSVLDANGKEIGTSEKSGYWTTSFTIEDESGHPIATIHRPPKFTNYMCDWWDVSVQKPGVIDPRMLAMLTAFKTIGDNKKAASDSSSSKPKPKGK
jgi:uncharacterized protein YxjI